MKNIQIILSLALCLISIKPALGQQAEAEADTLDVAATPAKVYLYRPKSPLGMAVIYAVFINDKQVGIAKNGFNYVFEVQQAEEIEIWGETEKKLNLKLNIEPGKEYFVKCGVKMGALTGRPKFKLMDMNKGKHAYSKLL